MAESKVTGIWGGKVHDKDGKVIRDATKAEIKAARGRGKTSVAKRDRQQAERFTDRMAAPYAAAAADVEAQAARGLTNEQIAEQYGAGYAAGGIAEGIAPRLQAAFGNYDSLLSGIAGNLPGGSGADINVTNALAGQTDVFAGNAGLAALYGQSLGADIGSSAAAGLAMVQGRRDERADMLGKEARDLRLQSGVAGADYMTPLQNILALRAARSNLSAQKLEMDMAKREEERRRSGGSGSGSSTVTLPGGETEEEKKARLKAEAAAADAAKKLRLTGAAQSNYGLDGLIGSYSDSYNAARR